MNAANKPSTSLAKTSVSVAFNAPSLLKKQRLVQIAALVLLLVLAGGAGYLLHPNAPPLSSSNQLPTFLPIPPHASLMRVETFLQEHIQNWYYTLPQLSEDDALEFYQAQLPHNGWQCVTWMTNTNMTFYGQALSGTGVYLTALRGNSKAQIYLGDQEYGASLIEDDVPDGAIGLKVSLEPAENPHCSVGA